MINLYFKLLTINVKSFIKMNVLIMYLILQSLIRLEYIAMYKRIIFSDNYFVIC